jgi:hypothetical protein
MKNEIGRRFEECAEEFQRTKDTVFNEDETNNMKEVREREASGKIISNECLLQ